MLELGILSLVNNLFYAYSIVLVIYALMSWLPGARESGLGQFINKLARPYLDIFDRYIPSIGGISFNVIIAIFVLQFIRDGLLWLLALILF
ncbi:YggT family protein [Aerococcaceae bacterium WGS1372]